MKTRVFLALSMLLAATIGAAAWFAVKQGWRVVRFHGETPRADTSAHAGRRVLFYRSPMHPWNTSEKPGKCPQCGMELAPIYADAAAGTAGHVKLGDAIASVIGVESTPVRVAPLRRVLRVAGVVGDDETRHRVLSARVPGRIEKLHFNQVGLEVSRGQPLVTIYSPDALTAQRVYLEMLRAGAGVVPATELALSREKLFALGLEESDIRHLETTQTPVATFTVRTPFDGTIITRKANEGRYVGVNDELFEIGDFSNLWFIFDAYERDLPALALNQKVAVTLPSLPGEIIHAPISFIDPNLDETTRTARVRVVLPNPQRRILYRQTARGDVNIETPPVLLAPRSSILHTRGDPVAYVTTAAGTYEPRSVRLGRIGDDDVEVLSGLREGERVVTRAAFLVDSQAQLTQVSLPRTASENPAPTSAAPAAAAPPSPASAVFAVHGEPSATTTPAAPTSAMPLSPALLRATLDATTALAADNLAAYQKHLSALKTAANAPELPAATRTTLAPLAARLVPGPSLKAARDTFEPFSNALGGLLRSLPADKRPAKIFQCRMTPVLGVALWLQEDASPLRNPFFGAEMPDCGAELK